MNLKDELERVLGEFAAKQREQTLMDIAGVISPLLTVICGEMPEPLRVADKLDQLAADVPKSQSSEPAVQVAARFATLLANAVRANAGAAPRPNG